MGKLILFADDTIIFVSGESQEIAVQKSNMILNSVSSYMYATLCILIRKKLAISILDIKALAINQTLINLIYLL